MSKLLSTLPVGSLVKDTGTTYYGESPIFRVLEHGHTGDPSGSTTLECKDVISFKSFDAKEPNNTNSYKVNYGNNRYMYSNLLQWLNSDADEWYTAKHQYDQSPNSTSVVQENAYSSEAGFLKGFSSNLKEALLTASKVTYDGLGGNGFDTVQSKIFLLSLTEIGLTNVMAPETEGSIYTYYSQGTISSNTNDRAIKKPTDAAVDNSTFKGTTGDPISKDSPIWWWTRSPNYIYNDTQGESDVYRNGGTSNPSAYYVRGVSPVFCIPSDTLVSDDPDANGVYTIVWDPTAHDGRIITVGNLRTFKNEFEDVVDDKIEEAVTDYSEGNGIDITSGVISIDIDNSNARGLSAGTNGLALAVATPDTYSGGTKTANGTAGAMSSADKYKLDNIGSISTSFIDSLFA